MHMYLAIASPDVMCEVLMHWIPILLCVIAVLPMPFVVSLILIAV